MSQAHADRNMLFGILALQMDFITRDQLVSAMQAWVFDKTQPLGKLLIKQATLDQDTHDLIEALVKKHLTQHGGDVAKSLAAVNSAAQVVEAREELEKVTDPDVQGSLIHFSPTKRGQDPYATRPSDVDLSSAPGDRYQTRHSVGEASSSGLRFRILRPHAKGGLGEVLVARDEELNREVALKQIQDRHAHDRESQVRFMLEAEITGGLEHPGIVPVYGLGHYPDGRPYYAMRFIRGDSLRDAIERFHKADREGNRDPGERSLELRSLLGRYVDVCNAIGYAHFRGVLHRDLKPGNIMLGKYGETLVVDWGLAKPLSGPNVKVAESIEPGEGTLTPSSASMASHTVMGSAMGTPQYMSPEQAAGRLDLLGPSSDVYSLGATLYSLLTGLPPIQDTEVGTVLQKVQKGDIPRPRAVKPDVPASLEAICLKAMSKLPIDRYADTKALADDIEHWLADEPVSAYPEPWTVKARRWINRHRTFVTTAASVVLVAAISLAIASGLLASANATIRKERDEKERQRALAVHNFQLARSAVDRYHTNVSQDVILHEPGMEPLRKKLLGNAREFYQKFVDERGKEPGLEEELGKATFRLAQITADIDSERDAIKLHEEAQKTFASLKATDPDVQSDMAANWHAMARIYRNMDQFDDSEKAFNSALMLWATLVKDHRKKDEYRAGEARSLLGMGNLYQVTRRLEDAQKVEEKALATRKELAAANKKSTEYQRDLAVNYGDLGRVYRALGENEKAQKAFEAAIAIQEVLVKNEPHISQYQDDLARSHFNLAGLHAEAREIDESSDHFWEAQKIWKGVSDRHPVVTSFRIRYGETWGELAKIYANKQQPAEAEDAAKTMLAVSQKLADEYKDVTAYQGDLARAYNVLGAVYRMNSQWKKADAAYHDALRILEKLNADPKAIPQYRADLARCQQYLGNLYMQQSDLPRAEPAYAKAREVWEKLVSDYRGNIEYAVGLSTVDLKLGIVAQKQNNSKAAVERFAKAIRDLDSLPALQRGDAKVQAALFDAHRLRADELTAKLGRHVEAIEDWNEARKYAPKNTRLLVEILRAQTLARAGEHAEAIEAAEAIAKDPGQFSKASAAKAFYQRACIYALASGAASGDVKMTPDQRTTKRDEYAEQAMKLLENARSAGYFKTPDNVKGLDSTDLDAIRERAEFRKLKEEVGSK